MHIRVSMCVCVWPFVEEHHPYWGAEARRTWRAKPEAFKSQIVHPKTPPGLYIGTTSSKPDGRLELNVTQTHTQTKSKAMQHATIIDIEQVREGSTHQTNCKIMLATSCTAAPPTVLTRLARFV